MTTADNILLITTDQQRFDTIQAWGNRQIFTPHLNYLAAEGINFTRAYADCPICMPSRTTIMTGEPAFLSGVKGNANHQSYMQQKAQERRTLPAALAEAGYQTKAMGKMHFEPARAHYGFEEMEIPADYLRWCDRNETLARPKLSGVGECEMEPAINPSPLKDTLTTWTVDRSIDFLETRDPLRPFFMWTSFTKPHPPFDPCREFWELYEIGDMPDPVYGDWSKTLEEVPQGFLMGAYENTNVHLFSPKQVKAMRRAYYALISQIDYALGRLLASLRENGLLENTWIIFTSDHGEMLGDHFASQKNLFFEGSAHVPLMIVPPQRYKTPQRGLRVAHLAQMCDIYPTILAMAGVEAPPNMPGRNLLDLSEDRTFYGNCLDVHFCVMEGRYKLVYCRYGGHYLLFDLEKDPMEQHNLYADPVCEAVREDLKKKMLAHARATAPGAMDGEAFRVLPEPAFPGDVSSHWFGFHYRDYRVDTFH